MKLTNHSLLRQPVDAESRHRFRLLGSDSPPTKLGGGAMLGDLLCPLAHDQSSAGSLGFDQVDLQGRSLTLSNDWQILAPGASGQGGRLAEEELCDT